jgi:hypothetical protein
MALDPRVLRYWSEARDVARGSVEVGLRAQQLRELQQLFIRTVSCVDVRELYRSGVQDFGFAPVVVMSHLILNGRLYDLLESGLLPRGWLRHLDSLLVSQWPSIEYYSQAPELLSPWITLSAQEVLLDLCLGDWLVIEYGSGMSSLFFLQEGAKLISFEDSADPGGVGDLPWAERLVRVAEQMGFAIDLRDFSANAHTPMSLLRSSWDGCRPVLVLIDGLDRVGLCNDWCDYLNRHTNLPIVLLLDNSEIPAFAPALAGAVAKGACLVHHYGPVYGQLVSKQCSSFITFSPHLLVRGINGSPSLHDRRWGHCNFQDND